MALTTGFLLFLFGLCVGSFLNVVVDWSVGKRKSFFRPRSFCDHCRRKLGFWDLVPVFSFLFLKGKCRYCQKPIPWQYPLVELAAGILFVLSPFTPYPILYALFWFSVLVTVFVADLRFGLIPDRIIFPAIVCSLPYSLLRVNYSLLAALGATAFFGILYGLTRGKGLGLGDVKLAFFLGLTLGWPRVILAMWVGFILGGLVAVSLLVLKKKKLKEEIPLGPFLVVGSGIGLFLIELVDKLGLGLKFFF